MPWIDWKVYRLVIWIVVAAGLLTTVSLCSVTQPTSATATPYVLECQIERPTPRETLEITQTLVNPGTGEVWVIRAYDTSRDGKVDAETLTYINGTDYPEYYFFDRDYDGGYDIGYHDALQNGSCWGVKVVWNKGMGITIRDWLERYAWHYPPGKEVRALTHTVRAAMVGI